MSEIVITVGYPGCGKTTHIQKYLDNDYMRLNRDSMNRGTKMSRVHDILEDNLHEDSDCDEDNSYILDNTYATIESRKRVIELGAEYGIDVRVDWLTASLENAQLLTSLRLIRKHGKLLEPDEIKRFGKRDPNCFPPIAQYGYRKRFEKPTLEEGFVTITEVPFKLKLPDSYTNSAVIFDYDGTLRLTKSGEKYPRSPDDIRILKGRELKLISLRLAGERLLGVSNQSGVSKGKLSYEDAVACFEKTNKLLNVDIEYAFCPHRAVPPNCFCRKPSPGWGAHFIEKYKLDPSKVTFVGDFTSDKTFATRSGFKFVHERDYF